jgi:hypothetical protein
MPCHGERTMGFPLIIFLRSLAGNPVATKALEASSYSHTRMNKHSVMDRMVVDNECMFTAFTNEKNNAGR